LQQANWCVLVLNCILYTNLVNIIAILGSGEKDHKKSEPLGIKGIRFILGNHSYFIVYAGFYTSLMDQRFGLLKKPGGCIKKGEFMQSLLSLKPPLAIHAAQNQCCTTENENG
jgi:hypothetical protein